MNAQTNSRAQRLILAGIVTLAILLLLLRLFVFAHGHGRHKFRGAVTDPSAATVRAARYVKSTNWAANWPSVPWTNRLADSTPDFLRLTDRATLEVQP